MEYTDKTELTTMRQRLTELEALASQHQQTIKELQRSATTLQALLESASDGIILVKTVGHIAYVNGRAEEMFGYQRDELLGQPIEVLLPEQFRSSHVQQRAGYLNRPRSRPMGVGLDLAARRRDGTAFPVEVSLSFIETDDEALIMCVVADISKRVRDAQVLQQTLKTLQKRNRDLALLNQASQTITATLDLQQVIERLLQAVTVIIDAQGSALWLWDQEEPGWLACQAVFHGERGLLLADLRLSPGQSIPGQVAGTGESLIVSAPEHPYSMAELDAQLGLRTTALLAVPLRVRETVTGVLEVVNKLKGAFDADDLALVETLAASAAIALENARLVEAQRQHAEELERRNEELDAFAHTVAHDLKNPLGIMTGFARVLEEGAGTIADEELHHYIRIIAQNGRKANNIINELLMLASVRKAEVKLIPLDMGSIIAEVQGRLAYMIKEYHAEIILPEKWPVALGQDAWVEEVWVNYISNAIKYGGRPPRVELGATPQANGAVCFWVRDNGPGIKPEDQARLFRPFTQFHQVRGQGHGLGLSIVRRIVEKLNGQVGVESQVGQGSLFFFTLPGAAS